MPFTALELLERDLIREHQWLQENPDFDERPASIVEFLGPDYLNIERGVRPGVKDALIDIFGDKPNVYNIALVQKAMFTGAIGIGKTTFASIALPYMVHWVLCIRDPQAYFELLPGSRIAFMQMSTSETNAKEVVFADIAARIKYSKWFRDKYPPDPKITRQLRFEKDIWIVPGDSSDTTFEGYNILGGIIDEMDSHKITDKKDYALDGYTTISNRITSRFGNRGLLMLIGQMKKAIGFAASKYQEFVEDGPALGCYAKRMTIWDSLGWHKFMKPDNVTRDSFWFDTKRKCIVNDLMVEFIEDKEVLMEIPNVYKRDFESNPQQALRDHAGIPPMVGDAFIGMVDKVEMAVDKWHARFGLNESPVGPRLDKPDFADWFHAQDTLKRVCHIDIAYSANGDALGFAMGHVRELKLVDDELRPYIVIDCLVRMRPLPGRQIILSDVRDMLYYIRNNLEFKLVKATLDGFESTDTMQQLRKKKFQVSYLSVDRQLLPYHDLREAINEERIEWPRHMTYMRNGDPKTVEIAKRELLQLVDSGKKIDHPVGGSKDVTDAMAGVVSTLMGDRQYRKGMSSSYGTLPVDSGTPALSNVDLPTFSMKIGGSSGIGMPSSNPFASLGSTLMPNVPDRLQR